MKYTAHLDPKIDQTIEEHMKTIVDHFLERLHGIDSIMLAGGFGRGEGSVRRLPDGRYLPMNDYDIYVFSDGIPSYSFCQALSRTLTGVVGVQVDIKFIRTSGIGSLIPDMFTYDLKSTARVIWGKNLKAQIPLEKSDIPLSAGLNTLFIEALGLVVNFEPEYLAWDSYSTDVPMFTYQCSKVFIEIGNALSLLGGFWDPHCSRRAYLFSQYYFDRFPELSAILSDLPSKVAYHTDLKLKSEDFSSCDLAERWLEAREALKYVIWYLVSIVLHERFDMSSNFISFITTRRRRLTYFYFEPYLRYAFRRYRIPNRSTLLRIAMPAVQMYENLRYMRNCYKSIKRVPLMPLLGFESPLMLIYLCSAVLLYSVDRDGVVNRGLLEEACRLIRSTYPCKPIRDESPDSWRLVRDACLHSHEIYASTPGTISLH